MTNEQVKMALRQVFTKAGKNSADRMKGKQQGTFVVFTKEELQDIINIVSSLLDRGGIG